MNTECNYDQVDFWREYIDGLDMEEEYEAPQQDMVENMWNIAGEC